MTNENEEEELPLWHLFLWYEVAGTWWAKYLDWGWAQTIAGKYFAWKVKRKYKRFKKHHNFGEGKVKFKL